MSVSGLFPAFHLIETLRVRLIYFFNTAVIFTRIGMQKEGCVFLHTNVAPTYRTILSRFRNILSRLHYSLFFEYIL